MGQGAMSETKKGSTREEAEGAAILGVAMVAAFVGGVFVGRLLKKAQAPVPTSREEP